MAREIVPVGLHCAAFEKLTVSNTVKTLTAAKYNDDTVEIVITVEDNDMRFTLDGTTPTTAIGHKVGDGDTITLHGYTQFTQFKAIRISADAVLQISYF